MFSWNGQESAEQAIGELKEQVRDRQGQHRGFFGRNDEIVQLLDYLGRRPEAVLAVIGPKSSGKSALLKEVERLWATKGVLLVSHPIIYVDCRLTNSANIGDAALAMKEAFTGFLDKVASVAESVTVTVRGTALGLLEGSASVNVGQAIRALRRNASAASTVLEMANVFRRYLAQKPRSWPTLVLDESQVMKEWPVADLKKFIGMFIAMTKQDHRAHLVVCSSDDFFIDWLRKSVETAAWKVHGIGPFPEEVARRFFQYMLSDAPEEPVTDFGDEDWNDIVEQTLEDIADDHWKQVFTFCGGFPLLLRSLAMDIKKEGGMDKLQNCIQDAFDKVVGIYTDGLYPETNDWTGEQYAAVAAMIVAGGGCVGFDKIAVTVFQRSWDEARRAVLAMVKANVLHIRYVSRRLTYIDMPALEERRHCYQVMAVNPSHLATMTAIVKDPTIADEY